MCNQSDPERDVIPPQADEGSDNAAPDAGFDAAEAEKMITVLMGDQIEDRKRYIQTHANFNKEDSFIKEVRK